MSSLIKYIHQSLNETGCGTFQYVNDDNVPYSDEITSLEGQVDKSTPAKPAIGDKIGKTLTVEPFYARQALGAGSGAAHIAPIAENNADDKDADGVDDFYDKQDGLRTLTDGNPENNLIRIPQTIQARLNQLISDIHNTHMNERQVAMVISKLINACNLKGLNYVWQKDLKLQVNAATHATPTRNTNNNQRPLK